MVADKFPVPMVVMMPMSMVPVEPYIKIRQYKEPREPEIPPPKRIWYPAIKVCIICGRCIVGDYGGPLVVIVSFIASASG